MRVIEWTTDFEQLQAALGHLRRGCTLLAQISDALKVEAQGTGTLSQHMQRAGALADAALNIRWEFDFLSEQIWDSMWQLPLEIQKPTTLDSCRVCGCSDNESCETGCEWVQTGLCSVCAALPIAQHTGGAGA